MRVWLALAALGLTACTHVVQWGDTKVVTTSPNASEVARDQAARVLAPTGVLRVGVYAGSPTSLVRIEGRPSGVAHDLGFALGQALGVPVLITEFPRVAEVVRALQAQQIDFTFTNASAERARWVDYSGVVDGASAGIAMFDHPSNLRHPTWWHARDYGLCGANPFGIHDFAGEPDGTGDHTIPAGGTLRQRYLVLFHEGDPGGADIEGRYRAWAGSGRAELAAAAAAALPWRKIGRAHV